MKNDLAIKFDKVAVQIGRTVITCTLKNDEVKEKMLKSGNTLSGQTLGYKK
jgi:hypothetical protein